MVMSLLFKESVFGQRAFRKRHGQIKCGPVLFGTMWQGRFWKARYLYDFSRGRVSVGNRDDLTVNLQSQTGAGLWIRGSALQQYTSPAPTINIYGRVVRTHSKPPGNAKLCHYQE